MVFAQRGVSISVPASEVTVHCHVTSEYYWFTFDHQLATPRDRREQDWQYSKRPSRSARFDYAISVELGFAGSLPCAAFFLLAQSIY